METEIEIREWYANRDLTNAPQSVRYAFLGIGDDEPMGPFIAAVLGEYKARTVAIEERLALAVGAHPIGLRERVQQEVEVSLLRWIAAQG